MIELPVTRLRPDAVLPERAYADDAGLDLSACEAASIPAGGRKVVGTGLAVAIPAGYAGLVVPRSGLAVRHGISIVNAPGLIDAGYRGEIKVLLVNLDPAEPVHLSRGDRIAQLVIQRFESASFVEAEALPESARGVGGYGSTGGFSTQTPGEVRAGRTTT